MTNQRMKWDAEAAFKRIDEQIANDEPSERAAADRNEMAGFSYAPPSNIGPERLAQLRKYEPQAKPHGRDIGSLMRYHAAHRKGRTDDDCLREKFGGQPLPSAGHGKDVDTTNGPWPKWAKGAYHRVLMRSAQECDGIAFDIHGYADQATCVWWCGSDPVWTTESEAAQWLEAHGHKDVAAQLRGKAINSLSIPTKLIGEEFEPVGTMPVVGDKVARVKNDRHHWSAKIGEVFEIVAPRFDKYYSFASRGEVQGELEDRDFGTWRILKRPTPPRDDVATGGGRVWMNRAPRHFTETCYEHWRAVLIDGKVCTRGAWNKPGVWSGEANDVPSLRELESGSYPELFGTERDAILSECRKAMGL